MPPRSDPLAQVLSHALGGDAGAMRSLISALLPIVHARVLRGLVRNRGRAGSRDLSQEVDDLTQEVFAALFAENARALRSWDPERGLSLVNFVGLIAEHEVAAILRTGRRSPWSEDPTLDEELADAVGPALEDDLHLMTRDLLAALLDRLRERLSPRGLHLFRSLVVEERPVEQVAEELGMTADAVYAWRFRFSRVARELLSELQAIPPSETRRPHDKPSKEVGR